MSILCFGGQDWWYHNRAHVDIQLMRRYAKKVPVLYINSIVMQKPNLTETARFFDKVVRKMKSIFTGLKKVDTDLWVYSPFSLPLHHISWARKLNTKILCSQIERVMRKLKLRDPILWVVCPAACDIAIKLKTGKMVYLRTDVYELFPNVNYDIIREYDQKLKANADLTLFASNALDRQESSQCRKSLYLDHGVDYEMFATADKDLNQPEDIKSINRPIIGYFGTIDGHTVDYELINKVANILPEMSFVFVGKVHSRDSNLPAKKNTWMLGQKPYEQIPHYGKCFDVAIMPWRQNRWIEVCNPIKLKEYLALGKPVVSTPFTELQKYRDVVYQADTPEEFARCIEKALAEDSPERVAARRKKVETSTWYSKAELVLNELFEK